MISIVACCHGAKLCAHAARDFRSQHWLLVTCWALLIGDHWKRVFVSVSLESTSAWCSRWNVSGLTISKHTSNNARAIFKVAAHRKTVHNKTDYKVEETYMRRWKTCSDAQVGHVNSETMISTKTNEFVRFHCNFICRLLASGNSFRTIAYSFRLHKSTVSGIIDETCSALWNVLQPICMPVPDCENGLKWHRTSCNCGTSLTALGQLMENTFKCKHQKTVDQCFSITKVDAP